MKTYEENVFGEEYEYCEYAESFMITEPKKKVENIFMEEKQRKSLLA